MNLKNLVPAIITIIIMGCSTYNGGWDPEVQKVFKKEYNFNLDINMTETSYCGLDSAEFVNFFAGKNNFTPEVFCTSFKLFKNEFVQNLNAYGSRNHLKFIYPKHDPNLMANIQLNILEIGENAGLKAEFILYTDDPQKGKKIYVVVDEGRWNKFDVLLRENASELAKKFLYKFTYSGIGF